MMRDYDRILHILGAIDDALESTDGIRKCNGTRWWVFAI